MRTNFVSFHPLVKNREIYTNLAYPKGSTSFCHVGPCVMLEFELKTQTVRGKRMIEVYLNAF